MITTGARALISEYRHAAIGLQAATEAAAFRASMVAVQEADLAVLVLTTNLGNVRQRAAFQTATEVLDLYRSARDATTRDAELASTRYQDARGALLHAHPHLAAFISG